VVDKEALGQVFSEYFFSPANHHSIDFSIIITTRGWQNRPVGGRIAEWTQLDSIPHYTNLKKFLLLFFNDAVYSGQVYKVTLDGMKFD
jgi:hypothetical protein